MDGIGRWRNRSDPRRIRPPTGAEKFKEISRYCESIGIPYVTVYAFSTENWLRPKNEVNCLMNIFGKFIEDAKTDYIKEKAHIVFIGNKNAFPEKMRKDMEEVERISSKMPYTLNVAINYGGHQEIVDAVNALISGGKKKITEDDISRAIYSGGSPAPDMIVRRRRNETIEFSCGNHHIPSFSLRILSGLTSRRRSLTK